MHTYCWHLRCKLMQLRRRRGGCERILSVLCITTTFIFLFTLDIEEDHRPSDTTTMRKGEENEGVLISEHCARHLRQVHGDDLNKNPFDLVDKQCVLFPLSV
jgi:hypothetical protein